MPAQPTAGGPSAGPTAATEPSDGEVSDAEAVDDQPVPRRRFRRWQRSDWPLLVALIAVLIPAARMMRMVRGSSKLQYNDYWPMITQVLRHDGGLDVGGVFKFRNEHPIAIPKVLYWVNARVFHGSNVTQGLIVILIVLTTVGLVGVITRRTPGLERWSRIAIVVGASVLFFSFRGSWYFVKGMSGTAWLTSHLFVVAAFAAHAKGRRFLPIMFGILACLSYGTGLAVWPALLLVAALRDRSIVRQWPTAVTGAVAVGWYWVLYQDVKKPRSPWFPAPTMFEGTKTTLTTIGSFVRFDDDGLTMLIGAAIVVLGLVAAAFVAWRVWADPPSVDHAGATAWVGLFIFSGTAAGLVSGTRYSWALTFTAGRYSIVGSTVCLAVLGLVLTAVPLLHRVPRPTGRVVVAVAFAAVLAIGLSGQFAADTLQLTRARQDTLQVALHLNLASGSGFWDGGWDTMPDGIEGLLSDTGQVPFVGGQTLGCGRLGQVVGDDELANDTPLSGQMKRGLPSTEVGGAVFIEGFVDTGDADVDCFIVRGDTGRVRGTGGMGVPADGYGIAAEHQSGRLWFQLLAQQAKELDVWYRLAGENTFHELPG